MNHLPVFLSHSSLFFRVFITAKIGPRRQLAPFALLLMCADVGCDKESNGPPSVTVPQPAAEQKQDGTETDAHSPANEEAGPFRFSSRLAESGIDFVQTSGNSTDKPFPAANGTGTGAVDFDCDGLPDLYFANGARFPLDIQTSRHDRLYRNLGQWKFHDVTSSAGIGQPGYSCGIAVGDIDNDGFPDLCVNRFGANLLYRNLGDGTFEEIASQAGVTDERWGTSATFVDFNNDGLLDLYVCNYGDWTWETNQFCGDPSRGIRMFCSPTHVKAVDDSLFENAGDGTFRNVSQAAGIAVTPGRGQGVLAADINLDGWCDLYVSNDIHPNFLFLNRNGTFQERGEATGTAFDHLGKAQAGMGLAAADVDRNGSIELFVTNYQNEHNALYLHVAEETWIESGTSRIPEGSLPWVGWGTSLTDFDLDDWPDLIVTNGHTDDNLAQLGREGEYLQPPGLWKNRNGNFELTRDAGSYFQSLHAGRGLLTSDLDIDGDPDVVISHQDGPPELLSNDSPTPESLARSVTIRLIGTSTARDAIGAFIHVKDGESQLVLPLISGGSYASASELCVRFQMPNEHASIQVHWPGGRTQTVSGLSAGKRFAIVENSMASEQAQCWKLVD